MEATSDGAKKEEAEAEAGPSSNVLRIFTDGISLNSGTKAHIGVYSVWIAENHPDNNAWWTKEGAITNQSMEVAGVHAGLNVIRKLARQDASRQDASRQDASSNIIYSTSHYVMNCMTKWLPRWEKTGWITKQRRPVHNGEMLQRMAEIARSNRVEFVRVPPPPHRGSPGLSQERDGSIHHGMRKAHEALLEAAAEGTHSGCTKQRGAITCEWSG